MKKLLKKLKEVMYRIAEWINEGLPTASLIVGALLIACGIGMIYRPAGIIALGVQLMFNGVLQIKGGGKDNE